MKNVKAVWVDMVDYTNPHDCGKYTYDNVPDGRDVTNAPIGDDALPIVASGGPKDGSVIGYASNVVYAVADTVCDTYYDASAHTYAFGGVIPVPRGDAGALADAHAVINKRIAAIIHADACD